MLIGWLYIHHLIVFVALQELFAFVEFLLGGQSTLWFLHFC